MEINSVKYWDKKYKLGDWQKNNGIEQTIYWGNLIIKNLPQNVIQTINNEKLSIIDFGCALGQIANIFSKKFPNSRIIGIDQSKVAIDIAKKLYPYIDFHNGELEKGDVIILSNIIEHFKNAYDFLCECMEKSNKYAIILCPYNENKKKLIPEHHISISSNFFKEEISGFKKVFEKIINTRDSRFWHGDEILCIYERCFL